MEVLVVKRIIMFMAVIMIVIAVSQMTMVNKVEASNVYVGSYPNGWSAYLKSESINWDKENNIIYCIVHISNSNSNKSADITYGFTSDGYNIVFANNAGAKGAFTVQDNKGYALEYDVMVKIAQLVG